MVLLTVLSVGLLGLSSISLRSSGNSQARSEAQGNARLALMLALGELQASLGPDQGVSARASSIDENAQEPNVVGAWQAWHWKPGTSSPDYGQKAQNFRGWLVSTKEPDQARDTSLPTNQLDDPVWMVNPATLGGSQSGGIGPALRASKVPVQTADSQLGSYAWAVMDESQKAPIQLTETPPTTEGERIAQRVAPSRARPEDIVESLAPDKLGDPKKIVSLDSAVVAVGKEAGGDILTHQADVTPYSVGLLTNTIEGGLKTDLTTIFESSSTSALNIVNNQQTLYNTINDGAPSWAYLKSHYQLNRRFTQNTGVGGGTPKVTLGTSTDLAISKASPSPGLDIKPATEKLLPVIAKLQIMFSAVTHYNHIQGRIDFYNNNGNPKGNQNYGCPHLVYDPVITLYNPYDVALDLSKIRVRIWDPPVVFGMKKNAAWLRSDYASGNYHGLARLQINNQFNANARRYFSFLLTEMRPNLQPGQKITLQPGEVKVFSPWVEKDWSWGKETAGGMTPRAFFDWNADNNFGNRDNRTGNTFGLETTPGWDPRAGLQVDHLTYSDGQRPLNTLYDFENPAMARDGWMAIKLTDTFTVEARPGRTIANPAANQPDFAVDLLAGQVPEVAGNPDTVRDMLRSYRFKMANPTTEISSNPTNPTIKRTFRVNSLLQIPSDRTPGGKSPFAILSMTAKTTKSNLDYAMPWVHNNPVVEGVEQFSTRVGNAMDSYDLRFEEVQDFNSGSGSIEFDSQTNRGYYGATAYAQGGVSNVPMFRVPVLPSASLGDLVTANLIASANLPRVTHAFGNSRAHPLIPSGAVSRKAPTDNTGSTTRNAYDMLDHSYMINDALWDTTYFSTVANYSSLLLPTASRKSLLEEFLGGSRKLLNPRLVPLLQGDGSAAEKSKEMDSLSDEEFAKRIGSVLGVQGPFNVNSDSVDAWKALLSSMRGSDLKGWSLVDMSDQRKTGFPRFGFPIAGDSEAVSKTVGIDVAGTLRWAGFRALDEDQIDRLANAIVDEIRERGKKDQAPSCSVAEFVNRRLGSATSMHVLAGLLQTAIDKSKINDQFHALDSRDLATVNPPNSMALTGIQNAAARQLKSAEGSPAILTQGDLLMALAPVITVRGDTFRIRAYGESQAKDGKVEAKAWCEAIVQRMPEYLDPADRPEVKTAQLQSQANQLFGRRFVITSFRWLSPEEV